MVEVQLGQGMVALVDKEDGPLVSGYNWHPFIVRGRCYARGRIKGGNYRESPTLLHRLILGAPGACQVDHINGNSLDNRKANLRLATNAENGANRGKTCRNISGFKGVFWDKRRAKWQAAIKVQYRRHYLGSFSSPAEAAHAYDDAARRLHGEFARLNFPHEGERSALIL